MHHSDATSRISYTLRIWWSIGWLMAHGPWKRVIDFVVQKEQAQLAQPISLVGPKAESPTDRPTDQMTELTNSTLEQLTKWPTDQCIDRSIDRMTNWPTDRLTNSLIDQFTNWPIDQPTNWSINQMTDWPIHRSINRSTDTNWPNDQLTDWPVH